MSKKKPKSEVGSQKSEVKKPTKRRKPTSDAPISDSPLIIPGGVTVGDEEPEVGSQRSECQTSDFRPLISDTPTSDRSPILDPHAGNGEDGHPRRPQRVAIAIPPPRCPSCHCQHCPEYERKTLLRDRILTRHECRNCGRRFARMLPKTEVVQSGAK